MRKKQCETALEELVAEKKVTLKEYGKAKVFLINQDRFPAVDATLLTDLDDQINIRREENNTLSDKVKGLEKELKEVTSSQTNDELVKLIKKLQEENEVLDKKVDSFKSGGIQRISEDQINETLKEQIFFCNNWKKYKRGCKELVDMISESADMNPKEFVSSLGLETDEDYQLDIKQFLQ